MLRARLGAMMQRQRQRLGLTQAALAERANLSLKYLGEIERGEANLTVEALERVATALNWDPWELFSTDRRPISQNVHQLLLAEILGARQRLQALADWLLALDPALRPPSDECGTAGASEGSVGSKGTAGSEGMTTAAKEAPLPPFPIPTGLPVRIEPGPPSTTVQRTQARRRGGSLAAAPLRPRADVPPALDASAVGKARRSQEEPLARSVRQRRQTELPPVPIPMELQPRDDASLAPATKPTQQRSGGLASPAMDPAVDVLQPARRVDGL